MATLWKTFKRIQQVASESGAYVFGGYVRDSLIHEQGAVSFYEARIKADDQDDWNYADPTCHSESYKARTLIPQDIDLYIDTVKIEQFYEALKKAMFHVRRYGPINHSYDLGVSHDRIEVTFLCNPLTPPEIMAQLPTIKVDILHKPDFEERDIFNSMRLDFMCNTLYITPDGAVKFAGWTAYSFPASVTHLQEITQEIYDKKAISLTSETPPTYRIKNMLNKDFKVTIGAMTFAKGISEEICMICHEEFGLQDTRFKNHCCVAEYHPHCYKKHIQTNIQGLCPYCRKQVKHNQDMVEVLGKFKKIDINHVNV